MFKHLQWSSSLYPLSMDSFGANQHRDKDGKCCADVKSIRICIFPQTAQTVLVVVVVFCLSWLPHHIVHLWVEFGSFPLNQASFMFRVIAHCLAYSNSSVNPIIYAFLSENFRKAYKQVFKCQSNRGSPSNEVKGVRSKAETPPITNCTSV